MTEEPSPEARDAAAVFAGRIDILYALGRHYLSLPFAVLCVPCQSDKTKPLKFQSFFNTSVSKYLFSQA